MPNDPARSPTDEPPAIELTVFVGGKTRLMTHVDQELEIGRQRGNEPAPYCRIDKSPIARVIVAVRDDAAISRTHLRIVPDGGQVLRLINASRNCRVSVHPGRDLMPGKACFVRGEVRLQIGRVTLLLRTQTPIAEIVSLCTPQPVGRADAFNSTDDPSDTRTSLVSKLGSSFDADQGDQLMIWLRAVAQLFYHAANNENVFEDAMNAVSEIVGVDHVSIQSCPQGVWQPMTWRTIPSDATVPSPLSTRLDLTDRDVASIAETLRRVASWKQTVLYLPRQTNNTMSSENSGTPVPPNGPHQPSGVAPSGIPNEAGDPDDISAWAASADAAVVAAPIFGNDGQLVGALVGLRRRGADPTTAATLSRLEASLIELIASGLPAERFES